MTGEARPRVLLVEDEAEVRATLDAMLWRAGFEVEATAHGEEALAALCGGFRPSVIVLDLWMPIMDGWTFLAAARPSVPVVVLSGVADVRPLPACVAGVLLKPVGFQKLIDAMRRVRGPEARRF
jgi:two-component system response regulator PrrA